MPLALIFSAVVLFLFASSEVGASTGDECEKLIEAPLERSLSPYHPPIPLDSRQEPFVQSIVDLYLASLGHRAAGGSLSDFRHSLFSRTLKDQLQMFDFVENGWQYQLNVPARVSEAQEAEVRFPLNHRDSSEEFMRWAQPALADLKALVNQLLEIDEKTGLHVTFGEVFWINTVLADLVLATEKQLNSIVSGESFDKGEWSRSMKDSTVKVRNALRALNTDDSRNWSPKKWMAEELQTTLLEYDLLFSSKGVMTLVVPRSLQVQERLALGPFPIHFIRSGTFYKDSDDLNCCVGYDLDSIDNIPGIKLIERISGARQTWQSLLKNSDDSAKNDLVGALLLFIRYEMRFEPGSARPDWTNPNNLLQQLMGPVLFSGSDKKFNEAIVEYFQETGPTNFRPWRFNNLTRAEVLAGLDEIVFRLLQDPRVENATQPSLFEFLRQSEHNAVTTQSLVTKAL